MASIQAKVSRGQKYYYIVESKRVNGKPRPVVLEYLGKPDALLKRLRGQGTINIRSFSHGHVMALLDVAQQLKIVEAIDRHVPINKKGRLPYRDGLSVGQSLLLAAVGRACHPTSKRGWARWALSTSLYLWHGKKLNDLTSQHFWDQMNAIPISAIAKIERDIMKSVCLRYEIKPDVLLYDTSNFFTYISSTNSRCDLPKRGKNKQRRIDLRQISLALMVSREHQLPLFHQVYEGSQADVTTFDKVLEDLSNRMVFIFTKVESITIVYDQGNNSKKNQATVDAKPYHYIASLCPSHHKKLVEEANQAFEKTILPTGEVIETYRVEHSVWGAQRTLIIFISETLRQGQTRGLWQWINKRTKALDELRQELENPKAKLRQQAKLKTKIDDLLKVEKLHEIIRYSLDKDDSLASGWRLKYTIDRTVLQQRIDNVFGRRILMTDQKSWSTPQIIMGYRGQAKVENVFRTFKNPFHDAIRPQFHWTDQKIRVHVYCVILGYLLARLAYVKAKREINYEGSLEKFLDDLEQIRIALIAEKIENTPGPPKVRYQLENHEIAPVTKQLIDIFKIEAKAPTV